MSESSYGVLPQVGDWVEVPAGIYRWRRILAMNSIFYSYSAYNVSPDDELQFIINGELSIPCMADWVSRGVLTYPPPHFFERWLRWSPEEIEALAKRGKVRGFGQQRLEDDNDDDNDQD